MLNHLQQWNKNRCAFQLSVIKPKPIAAIRRKETTFKSQWELKLKIKKKKLPKARENVGNQVVIGSSFASDWLGEMHEFSRPIKERS